MAAVQAITKRTVLKSIMVLSGCKMFLYEYVFRDGYRGGEAGLKLGKCMYGRVRTEECFSPGRDAEVVVYRLSIHCSNSDCIGATICVAMLLWPDRTHVK